jgi:integrase
LRYRAEVDYLNRGSLRFEESLIIHLLEWAQSSRLTTAPRIRPTFPEYVLTARRDLRSSDNLSSVYALKAVATAKRYFGWAIKHKLGYKAIPSGWLETLKLPPLPEEPKEHIAVTLEYVRGLSASPVRTLREERIRAAAIFWFLSGIRVGAFVSLPVEAIDLAGLEVKQWPSLGVKTKFRKHATTFLLNIPDLLDVVIAWDKSVRSKFNPGDLWFSAIDPKTLLLVKSTPKTVGKERHTRARKDFKDWTARLGIPYFSPHKFRHGHAVYALENALTVADLKAISLNLMHSDLKITDGIYAILSNENVKLRITSLGQKVHNQDDLTQIVTLLNQLKEKLH